MSFRDTSTKRQPVDVQTRVDVESAMDCADQDWKFEFLESLRDQMDRGFNPSEKQKDVLGKILNGEYDGQKELRDTFERVRDKSLRALRRDMASDDRNGY